ncbi:hypothetical protein PMAC_000839 [Pneumocystis sp. 'macacae']|nr:hypothetical protein PMAC_000839 [Pneumocystis sp. 'macacae']
MTKKKGFCLSRPVSRYFAGKGPEQVESEDESDCETSLENKTDIPFSHEQVVPKIQVPILGFQKIDIHEKINLDESQELDFCEIKQNVSENLESSDEVTEYETEETEESEIDLPKIRLKPIFVPKNERDKYVSMNHFELEKQKIVGQEKRKEETRILLEEEIRKDEYKHSSDDDDGGANVDDTDDLCPESERAAWKLRELFRIKREKMFFEEKEREREEIERRRNMDEEERLKEDLSRVKELKENQPKSKMRFLQKWYHRGAFYQDEEILKRDYSVPVMDEISDKTLLPSTMQVRGDKFGKRGQTRYTHLVDQDTSTKDSPWFDKNINKRILPGTDDYNRKKRKF